MQDGGKHMSSWQIFSIRKTKIGFFVLLVFLLFISIVISLMLGAVEIKPLDVLKVLWGQDMNSTYAKIILHSRMPRVCASILAGAALAVSGMVIQTVLNNPLASPSIIGVNASAGFAVAMVCAIAPQMQAYTPVVSFIGALVGVFMVMILSQSMVASKITVVLAGVAISNLFSAGIDMVVTFDPDALNGVTDFRIGGFDGVTMEQLLPVAIMIVVSILVLFSLSQQLDVLALGSDTAQSLGLAVRPMQVIFLVLAAALAGAAVSFSGLLGFIGLIVPNIVSMYLGDNLKHSLGHTALLGAVFLLICDIIGRLVIYPYEVSIGLTVGIIGSAVFLYMLMRRDSNASA